MKTIAVRKLAVLLVLSCGLGACGQTPEPPAELDDATRTALIARIDGIGDDIESAEALRAIKRLQWAYGHYSEFGLWHDFADLFADTGVGHYTQGDLDREGIRALFLDQVGQGQLGLARGRIYPHISFSPVLGLDENRREAAGRFRILAMLGGYGGNSIWFHGVYQNAYVNEGGVWKINELTNAAQVSGSFTAGLSSQTNGEPAIVFFYGADEVDNFGLGDALAGFNDGVNPADATATDVRQLGTSLAVLNRRLDLLDDEAAVLRLQHQYGYYFDRHDWDALVTLFAEQGNFEHGLQGVYVGRPSIRRALDQFGDGDLAPDEIDDHILFQTYVSVSPDGLRARARVDELGLRSTVGADAHWTQGIYENNFVKENGEWRIESLHYYPRLITDYAKGWGADAQPAPGPSAELPPDSPPTEQYGIYPEFHIPAFHFPHPVTGRAPQYPEGDPAIGRELAFPSTPRQPPAPSEEFDLAALRSQFEATEARVQRALAFDAVENLVNAYAYFLDECSTQEAALLFADTGEVRIAEAETGRGSEAVSNILQSAYCPSSRGAGDLTLHHVTQPVITVADDGRTATFASRLWEVHASNEIPDFYRGGLLEGEARYENGRWKLLTLGTSYTWTAPVAAGPP